MYFSINYVKVQSLIIYKKSFDFISIKRGLFMSDTHYKKIAIQVSVITIIVNVLLFIIKFIAGIVGHSSAMISDAFHSLSDVLSTIIVIIGVKLAKSDSDIDHQYGHERFECIAAILLSFMLFATGLAIGYAGIEKIYMGSYVDAPFPTNFALYAAIISLIIKEGMFWYVKIAADKIKSDVLRADAWHHRSDALSSVASFIGILGAQLGFVIFDPIASIVICFFIFKVSYEIFINSIDKVLDKAVDQVTEKAMQELILKQEDVKEIDSLKTRQFGQKIYVDLEIAVDPTLSLMKAHEIAERVHSAIEENFLEVKHCMVHVNPLLLDDAHRQHQKI